MNNPAQGISTTCDTHASTIDKLLHCYKLLTATATATAQGEGWKKVGRRLEKVGRRLEKVGKYWRRSEEGLKKVGRRSNKVGEGRTNVGIRSEECWKKVGRRCAWVEIRIDDKSRQYHFQQD